MYQLDNLMIIWFTVSHLWSMIHDPAWSAWDSRKEIRHLHLSVDRCLPWVRGWEFFVGKMEIFFRALRQTKKNGQGPRAKGLSFCLKHLFVGCGTDWARFKLWAFFEYHPWGHPCARTIPVCVREDWPPRARRWKRRGAIETTVAQKTHRFSWQMMMK